MPSDEEMLAWEQWLHTLPQTLAAMANEKRNFPATADQTEVAVYALRPGVCLLMGTDRLRAQRLHRALLELLQVEQIQLLAQGWSDNKDTFALAVQADPHELEARLARHPLTLPPGEHETN
jgi:hypothetical protein